MTNYSNDLKLECSKNMVIGEAVGVEVKVMSDFISTSVNFFTPEGQVKLAGALLEADEVTGFRLEIEIAFSDWLKASSDYFEYSYLEIIAETKLAELFWEFMKTEKRSSLNGGGLEGNSSRVKIDDYE